MNYRLVAKYLGYLAFALALLMIPALLWAIHYDESGALTAVALSIATTCVIATILTIIGRTAPDRMWQREVLILISVSWIFAAILCATPFLYSGLLNPIDALFESMSGLTTTGSTVFTDLDETPRSILFWRATLQWIGGAATVLLFIAVLPFIDAGGKLRYRSEATSPDARAITPRIRDTASILYKLYGGLSLALLLALTAAGMPLYDALCHTMSTISTGGFTLTQAGIATYNSPAIEAILILGMLAAGTSFALYILALRGDALALLRDLEWRTYICVAAVATIVITLSLAYGIHSVSGASYTLAHSARLSAFQTVSILTSTGFIIDVPHQWPSFSRVLLYLFLFTGGCAASTAGGVKIVRILIATKMAHWRLENTFRPKTIRAIRISDQVVDDNTRRGINSFFVVFTAWLILGSLILATLGLPFEVAFAATAANLNNAGPALALASETYHYADVPLVGKLFLTLTMVLGRLELLTICVLFVPAFWKHS